jgi:acetyl-CoA acetyltransferase
VKNKVAIVSYGIMNYQDPNGLEMWQDEATYVVSRKALDAINLNREDIDAVIISTMDAFDGITISNGLLAPAAGAYGKDSVRLENSCAHSIMTGMASILSGSADLVVVASADTLAFDLGYVSNSMQDAFFRGPIGFNVAQSYGLLSMDYMNRWRLDEAALALVAAKNYKSGAKNPFAHVKRAYTPEEILSSPYVSWPLKSLEIGETSNGAAACILASEGAAKELTKDPVWIAGTGISQDSYYGSWGELSKMRALKKAAQKAYSVSGIKNPRQEIDCMEVCNPFSASELIICEALDLCDEGDALTMLRDGTTSDEGDIPVNISGGAISTNAPNSGGLFRIIQALKQFQNEFKMTKMNNARRALVHDSDMICGAIGGVSHAILILERGEK